MVEKKKAKAVLKQKMTREDKAFYMILIPFLSTFFVFNILPVLASIGLSFFDFDMVSTPIFIGLENYIRIKFYFRWHQCFQ